MQKNLNIEELQEMTENKEQDNETEYSIEYTAPVMQEYLKQKAREDKVYKATMKKWKKEAATENNENSTTNDSENSNDEEFEIKYKTKMKLVENALANNNLLARLYIQENRNRIEEYATDFQIDNIMLEYKSKRKYADENPDNSLYNRDYSFSWAYGDERDMQYTFFSGIIDALVLAIDTNDWYTVAEILTGKAYRDWENDDKYSTPYENYIGDESYRVNNELLNT